jgi:hypothetical protein
MAAFDLAASSMTWFGSDLTALVEEMNSVFFPVERRQREGLLAAVSAQGAVVFLLFRRINGWHPDDLRPHFQGKLHREGIDAPHRIVQNDAGKEVDAFDLLHDVVDPVQRGEVVMFKDQRPHAQVTGVPGDFLCGKTLEKVRVRVDVNIDSPLEQLQV